MTKLISLNSSHWKPGDVLVMDGQRLVVAGVGPSGVMWRKDGSSWVTLDVPRAPQQRPTNKPWFRQFDKRGKR